MSWVRFSTAMQKKVACISMHRWARRCTHHRVIWPGIIPARLLLAVSEAAIFAALVVARGFVAAPCPAQKIQPSVSQILDVNQTSPKFLLFLLPDTRSQYFQSGF